MQQKNREIVVITGASAGVSRATVREFARRGAIVCAIARDEERLEQTRTEIENLGGIGRIAYAFLGNERRRAL